MYFEPEIKKEIQESLSAVLPITGIVLLISIVLVPLELGTMVMFITGAVMLVVGMGSFQMGAGMSMTPLGEGIGVQTAKVRYIAAPGEACAGGILVPIGLPIHWIIIPVQYVFHGQGTATSEIMDTLGLCGEEKHILVSILPKAFADAMLVKQQKKLHLGPARQRDRVYHHHVQRQQTCRQTGGGIAAGGITNMFRKV